MMNNIKGLFLRMLVCCSACKRNREENYELETIARLLQIERQEPTLQMPHGYILKSRGVGVYDILCWDCNEKEGS